MGGNKEHFLGLVGQMDKEATEVFMDGPDGKEFSQSLTTEILRNAGINSGDVIEFYFRKRVRPGRIRVTMTVGKSEEATKKWTQKNIAGLRADIQGILEKAGGFKGLRQIFGNHE